MKKGLGVLLMILVVVLGALLKAITGSVFGSTEGFIERIPGSIILCGLFFLGWSLFKSTDKLAIKIKIQETVHLNNKVRITS